MVESFEIESSYNTICGCMVFPKGTKKYPCVILSHGLVSSKDSDKYIALSERFAEAGIATCRFDYHGCGESSGTIEETTLTIRVENLERVAEFVFGHPLVMTDKVGILGSSFGGTTAIVKAARDKRIRCTSLWATPYRVEYREDGRISDITFKKKIFKDFARYNILGEAAKISCALVIHGEKDDVVSCEQGKTIYSYIQKPKKIIIIKNGDHIFSMPTHREKAITLSLNWFRRFFLGC